MVTWHDDNPYYLMIQTSDEFHQIDLGERGWIAKYNELGILKAPGTWLLIRKDGNEVKAMLLVLPGEEPYYVRRHVGFAGVGDSIETSAFGIGKKRLDGHVDRIWILSNGCTVTGDDLEPICIRLLKQGLL